MTMKNGFTWQGFEADLRGGSFGRAQASFQYGKQVGDFSTYIAGKEISPTAAGGWTAPRKSAASTATSATRRTAPKSIST